MKITRITSISGAACCHFTIETHDARTTLDLDKGDWNRLYQRNGLILADSDNGDVPLVSKVNDPNDRTHRGFHRLNNGLFSYVLTERDHRALWDCIRAACEYANR